jgi:hypothetical protein
MKKPATRYNAGMKTAKRQVEVTIQRTLAILWLPSFVAGPCYWLWEFLYKSAPAYDGIHALLSLPYLFGVVASICLFRGAKWARISIGFIAIFFGVGTFWELWQKGWMRADMWAVDAMFVFSLVSAVLFFPRHAPIVKQLTPKSD